MIVDDDDTIRDMVKEFLVQNGFQVREATSGIEGMEEIKKNPPGLVITDLLLPGEHGIDLIKTVKRDFNIPVIVISGIYKKGEISKILNSELVDAFFPKPLTLEKILVSIHTLLNG